MLNSNTADIVRQELEKDLYLLETLADGIINTSSLARRMLSKIQKQNPKATIESISIAIKRYSDTTKRQPISKRIRENIAHSTLSSKNDTIHLTYKRNNEVLKALSEASGKIKWDEEEVFLINQGPGEVSVITDKKNLHLLKSIERHQIEHTNNLTIISVKETAKQKPESSITIPGVYAHLLTQLARKGINLIAVNSTLSQLTFAVQSKDFINAYETLQQAIQFFRL